MLARFLNNVCCRTSQLLNEKVIFPSVSAISIREYKRKPGRPRLRNPTWFTSEKRKFQTEYLTDSNKEFIQEVIKDEIANQPSITEGTSTDHDIHFRLNRTGVLARKIGIAPLWFKDGGRITTTLLQVLDNHVVKYFPPGTYNPSRPRPKRIHRPRGCVLVGAEAIDPTKYTKEYCGLFKGSGVVPKKHLCRFFVTPNAAPQVGTVLTAMHFPISSFVDVRGLTVDRGFQGVIKRWGFKGMPKTHGTCKSHRRGGCIGGGARKAHVWKGKKMPGNMGLRWRYVKAVKVWRINTRYNVLYVSGHNVPGSVNSLCYVFDTYQRRKMKGKKVPVPTYFGDTSDLPENLYDEKIHPYGDPTIMFEEEKKA